jgi:hypothetical protein
MTKMNFNYVLLLSLILIISCKSDKKENEKHINVFGYIKGQLKHLDTVPYGILKIKQIDTVITDSVFIDVKKVREMVEPFMELEPDEDYFNDRFTQSVFGDATIGTITVSYLSKKNTEVIERMDVYANPSNGEIKQVYILKREDPEKKIGKQQLLWTHNKGFSIFESSVDKTGSERSITNKVIWQ